MSSENAAAVCDDRGVIKAVTAALANMMGYMPEEVTGRSFREFVTLSNRRQLVHDWIAVTRPGHTDNLIRMTLQARDGDLLPILMDVTPLGTSDYLISYQGARRGRQQLAALNEVLSGLNGTLSLSQILDLILEQLAQVVSGEFSTLVLWRGGRLRPVRARGHNLRTLRALPFDWQDFDNVAQVFKTRRPLIINDCLTDSRWRQISGSEYIRSWLGIPLLYKGKFLGVLEVMSSTANRFTIADASAAQLFAQQAAAAIRHAQLYRASRERAQRLTVINDIETAMARLDVASVIRLVSERVITLIAADVFYIALYDQDSGTAHFSQFYDQGTWHDYNNAIPLTGLIGYVLRRRETLYVRDDRVEHFPVDSIGVGDGDEPRSILVIPLIAQGEVIGVLSAQNYQPNRYKPAEIRMLETIAGQVAVALHNAQLYKDANDRSEMLTSLQGYSAQMAGRIDSKAIYDLMAQETVRLLRPDELQVYSIESENTNATPRLVLARTADPLADPEATPASAITSIISSGLPVILNLAENNQAGRSGLWVGYPIRRAAETYGVLVLLFRKLFRFRPDQRRILSLLLNQTASALETARQTADMTTRLNEVRTLYRIAIQVSGRIDLDTILHDVVQTLYGLFPCRECLILLRESEPNANWLRIRAVAGTPFDQVSDRQFPANEGVFGEILDNGYLVNIPDVEPSKINGLLFDRNVHSAMIVPLMASRDQTFGVLAIGSTIYEAFRANHESILTIAAVQIAAAIDNARLYEEARDRALRLDAANHELQALDQLRTELVQNLSHELRAPLTFVKGYASLLHEGNLGEVNGAQIDALSVIERKADTIARLVADILTLETLDQRDLRLETINLVRLASQAATGAALANRSGKVNFKTIIEAETLPIIGDSDRLNQVLDNLIGNAVKFSPDGGLVTVRVWAEDTMCCVSVTDTGIGIAPDKIIHIFERFYQADNAMRRRFGGAGLGLSIVQRIVQAHNGQVEVSSIIGQGSVFTVKLPLVDVDDMSQLMYVSNNALNELD